MPVVRGKAGQGWKRVDEVHICTGDSLLSRGATYPASNKPKDADLSECLQEDILKQDRKKSPQCIVCPFVKGFWELRWSSEYKNGFFFYLIHFQTMYPGKTLGCLPFYDPMNMQKMFTTANI